MNELNTALDHFSAPSPDNSSPSPIRCILLAGSSKAFAAGADIKEMSSLTFADASSNNFLRSWSHLTTIPIPIIACVSGYALGGGCELAMMCDVIYCTNDASFGQPEIKLGVIPGAAGSQRLTRAIGKSRAMELILTGRNFSGKEAVEWGLASKGFDDFESLMEGAQKTAATIASYSTVATRAAKEVVNKSQQLSLAEGVDYERKVFHGLFGSRDQKVGMEAFVKKEKPVWEHK